MKLTDLIVSLDTLARGAVNEQFGYNLTKVVNNILDPNTNPCKARTIIIKIELKPDMKREMVSVKVGSSCSLQPDEPVTTTLFIEPGKDGNKVSEFNGYEQEEIPMLFTDKERV